jgi:hypothetical protein
VAATLIITAFDGYAAPTYVEEGLFAGADWLIRKVSQQK